jgi:alpha 1,3-glucosidase
MILTLSLLLLILSNAEGELYVDDGTSFNFQRGEYIHVKFKFEGGRLSAQVHSPKQIDVESVVERVILIGSTSPFQTAQAEVIGSHISKPSLSEISRYSVSFTSSSYNYVIRYPATPIHSDWVITLS